MATPSIRGHQGQIEFFKNGQPTNILNITRFEVAQDSSFSRSFYVGNPIPEGDQTIDGWSGSADLEVKDDTAEQLIDALINSNLAGVGVDEVTMVLTENYPDGRLASYVYSDMQMKLSKTNPGQNEKVTKRLEFQASIRTKL